MKSYNRSDRISQQIKRELSDIIQRNEIKDDRISGLVSITDVQVSGDLRSVKVYFSVYGEESQKVGTLAALEGAAGFLRGEICRRLGIRFAPELVFKLDDCVFSSSKGTPTVSAISLAAGMAFPFFNICIKTSFKNPFRASVILSIFTKHCGAFLPKLYSTKRLTRYLLT